MKAVDSMKNSLRYRQIHLDFHYSSQIDRIGVEFNKEEFQRTLLDASVDSITLFATCHHGWSYYRTAVGEIHPKLDFDLLKAQYDACLEVDVNVQLYLSVEINNRCWDEHPEWRQVNPDGTYKFSDNIFLPRFRYLCLNTPYVDLLCGQIKELATTFPDAGGVFMDIVGQGPCCCNSCFAQMRQQGMNPADELTRIRFAKQVLKGYYERTCETLRNASQSMGIFHNSGHISRGRRDILKYFTHLELESLPTGGWGYDHFPLSAKYAQQLGMEYVGMTGKFHTTWGEMGGCKHPNALRYECAAMLANGARCSIGDHPQPGAHLDPATYTNIGGVYGEVRRKEPWCKGSKQIADIALLSAQALGVGDTGRENPPDTGAARFLLEEHLLFDVVDRNVDFSPYKMLILPDLIAVDANLHSCLNSYVNQGGKLVLSGDSGKNGNGVFVFDVGAEFHGESEFELDYILPHPEFRPDFIGAPLVMYWRSNRIKVTDGISLGDVYDPYFNRTWEHFSGHQHAPSRPIPSPYACGVCKGNILYFAHPIFSSYYQVGAVAQRQYMAKAIRHLLADDVTITTNLPSTARVALTEQPDQCRHILHLLYANTIKRGANMGAQGGAISRSTEIELIEELLPLHDVQVELKVAGDIGKVTLEPQGFEIPFSFKQGYCVVKIDSFTCHQMVVFSRL